MYACSANGLLMEKNISKIYELIKNTKNLIELEERIQRLMYEVFTELLGEVFTQMDQNRMVSSFPIWYN